MRALLDFFKKRLSNGKRHRSWSEDPAKGIEYNEINETHRVSKRLYSVDIARTPRVIKDMGEWVDTQRCAHRVNRDHSLVNYKRRKVHGRER